MDNKKDLFIPLIIQWMITFSNLRAVNKKEKIQKDYDMQMDFDAYERL